MSLRLITQAAALVATTTGATLVGLNDAHATELPRELVPGTTAYITTMPFGYIIRTTDVVDGIHADRVVVKEVGSDFISFEARTPRSITTRRISLHAIAEIQTRRRAVPPPDQADADSSTPLSVRINRKTKDDAVTFDVIIRNDHDVDQKKIRVEMQLPRGFSLVEYSGPVAVRTIDENRLDFREVNLLRAGEAIHFSVVGRAVDGNELAELKVWAFGNGQQDLTRGRNRDAGPQSSAQSNENRVDSALLVEVTGPDPHVEMAVGERFTYFARISNKGSQPLEGVRLTWTTSKGMKVVTPVSDGIFELGALLPGEVSPLPFELELTEDGRQSIDWVASAKDTKEAKVSASIDGK